ncbi:MAG TPA: phosphodiester glycosidase family protein, partial [Clostridia bacterium]
LMNFEGKDIRLKGYMIIIHDPKSIKVGYSSKMPVEGELTSGIAKRNGALAAINAGGFEYKSDNNSWTSTGGKCEGFIIHDGEVIINRLGSDTEKYLSIGFNSAGKLIFGDYSVNKLKSMGVNEAVCSFGPKLIVKGKKMFKDGDTGGLGYSPRTAIGQKANGDVVFLVFEGRDLGSAGASVSDLQQIMYEQGVVNAINLDGGSSTSMYFNGKMVNKPSNIMGERAVPSIFMVLQGEGSNK